MGTKTKAELQQENGMLQAQVEETAEKASEILAENEALREALSKIEGMTAKLKALQEQMDGQYQNAPVTDEVRTTKENKEIDEYLMERIPARFFKDNEQYKDDIQLIYRGRLYNIQRGKNVMIPRGLAMAIEDAERQNLAAVSAIEGFSSIYRKSQEFLN